MKWWRVWLRQRTESENMKSIHGKQEVEVFLDAVLAIEEHIDPSLMRPKLAWNVEDTDYEDEDVKAFSI